MGGYCALALARRAPERVVGMTLVGARADADSFQRRRFREEQIADLPQARRLRSPMRTPTSSTSPWRRRRYETGSTYGGGGVVRGPLLVCVGDPDELFSVDEARELADRALDGTSRSSPAPATS